MEEARHILMQSAAISCITAIQRKVECHGDFRGLPNVMSYALRSDTAHRQREPPFLVVQTAEHPDRKKYPGQSKWSLE